MQRYPYALEAVTVGTTESLNVQGFASAGPSSGVSNPEISDLTRKLDS
jgi:hypothetical protein